MISPYFLSAKKKLFTRIDIYPTVQLGTMSELELPEFPDGIFVNADHKPYRYYLCPPLDTNSALVQTIEENGGIVAQDLSHDSVVIGDKDYPIPESLRDAHIYSYKVVEDSANSGMQVEFSNYLYHQPATDTANERVSTADVADTGDEEAIVGVSAGTDNVDSVSFPVEDFENAFSNEPAAEDSPPTKKQKHGVNYFTQREDEVLKEEIRKRPWLGFKGHQIYKVIAEMPYFRERERTAASLRERIRTLKYDIQYVYKGDEKKKVLLVDNAGNYIKDYTITTKVKPFTAEDDFGLCLFIYQNLPLTKDKRGIETVFFPTKFFDFYSDAFKQHPNESWRQRNKNYLVVFGITNYLKYYILHRKMGEIVPPANEIDRNWMIARRELKKNVDGDVIYFPLIPNEDTFIDENMDSVEVPGLKEGHAIVLARLKSANSPIGSVKAASRGAVDETHLLPPVDETHILPAPIADPSDTGSNSNHEATETLQDDQSIREWASSLEDAVSVLEDQVPDTNEIEQSDVFIDAPTTSFFENAFEKFYASHGAPMDVTAILPQKTEFYARVHDALSQDINLKKLPLQLKKFGIQPYYTLFIAHRCSSNPRLMEHAIHHYVESGGRELLSIEPGVWSNKAIKWLQSGDKDKALIAYHGEDNFNQQKKVFQIVGSIQ